MTRRSPRSAHHRSRLAALVLVAGSTLPWSARASASPDSGVAVGPRGVASSTAGASALTDAASDSTLRIWVPSVRATTGGRAEIVGTSLTVDFHDGRTERLGEDGGGGGAGADPMAFPNDYHRALIEDFLSAVETGGAPRISGEEALQVHRLIDAMLESAASASPVNLHRA